MSEFIDDILIWISNELKAIFINIYGSIMMAFAALIEAIPVPDFLQDLQAVSLPPGVLYFLDIFLVPQGAGIVTTALVLRFLIRRIPFVG